MEAYVEYGNLICIAVVVTVLFLVGRDLFKDKRSKE